jgi:hypothetical protein
MGLVVLLPIQQIYMVLFWQEMLSFGGKKNCFSMKYGGKSNLQTYAFYLTGADLLDAVIQQVLESAHKGGATLKKKSSVPASPFPLLYPPSLPSSFEIRLADQPQGEATAQAKTLREKRTKTVKKQIKTIRMNKIAADDFTMKFMEDTLADDE